MARGIIFNCINVNSQNNVTAISVGKNHAENRTLTKKTNLASNKCVGANYIIDSINNVMDNDVVDAAFSGKIFGNISKE